MALTFLHGQLLGRAFEQVLGQAESGTMAFVRCLTPDVVTELAAADSFAPQGWQVFRVADADNIGLRTITADGAVEKREIKGEAVLLLVDTDLAGAGMDGIYSASLEVGETDLFEKARRLAGREVTSRLSSSQRQYAEQAIRKATGFGDRYSISPWTAFDFLCRIAAHARHPGTYLHLLGLWPAMGTEEQEALETLNVSRRFVDQLLGTTTSGLTIRARIESLHLAEPTENQRRDLERFLHAAEVQPLMSALKELADKEHLWVGALRIESTRDIQSIELTPWRNRNGRLAKWSGLMEESDDAPPVLILKPEAEQSGDYSKLEIRWRVKPDNLDKNAVDYHVAVLTGNMEEELATREVRHSARREERCRFSNDDFSSLNEDALVSAKVVISVIGNDAIESQESEEYIIRFGQPPESPADGVGKKVRTLSEGLAELGSRETVSAIAASPSGLKADAKGFVLLRTSEGRQRKSFRVFRPPLIHEVEKQWTGGKGAIGRWRVKVRASGIRAGEVEFLPVEGMGRTAWNRAGTASRRMAQRFGATEGGVGQVYDDRSKTFDTVKDYVLAWTALLEGGDPSLALCHTVEVQSLSGRTIGLIVLPSHPLRVAWQAAYDNLALYAAFEQRQAARDVRDEFACLDGAMFPAFLPHPEAGGSFVFADTLGFHTVGMVPDSDKEPKAAVAILARALGESESADTAPTVGGQSATILGDEIIKYLNCHDASRLLRIHALRAGDGLTIAKSLGRVHRRCNSSTEEEDAGGQEEAHQDFDVDPRISPSFSLELYPSSEQRGIAGRFIAEARERRRSGAGILSSEDRWMLESVSLPGDVNIPRLRWARKELDHPKTAAHLAVAFDTFESQVLPETIDSRTAVTSGPFRAFGLLSFYERSYTSTVSPSWRSTVPQAKDGERHPSERGHTERLERLQRIIQASVARHLGADGGIPVLRTEVSPEKADGLRELHRLCDWVITLDRNAGIEYFDSPRENREIYDAYVIDCVPEREDLGCLQLITSTSNLEEVRNLLDESLDRMGLSRSRRNAEFLLEHLKSLSGRLAIRLTGNKPPTSELIALAVAHASCPQASENDDCWTSLAHGFFVPVDDVRDLLPPLRTKDDDSEMEARPDLIYVSTAPRKGLAFRFIEVKYRRHLRAARTPEVLRKVRAQTESLCKRWHDWYSHDDGEVCSSFRAVRRAKLARVLRFYADKAHRHCLPNRRYEEVKSEIDRMIERGGDYAFQIEPTGNRGWVFCPEYAGFEPLKISPPEWSTRIFLFGPGLLPDSDFRPETATSYTVTAPHERFTTKRTVRPAPSQDDEERVEAGPDLEQRAEVTVDHTADEPQSGTEGEQGDPHEIPPSICFGTDTFTNTDVRWSVTTKGNPHLLIAGLPGMGKTTCLLNLCRQMIAADIRPLVFSYHQDIDEKLEQSVDSIRFVDFDGLNFNPLQVLDRNSRMAHLDVAGAIRDIFAAIYPELGDIQTDRIRRAIKGSFDEMGWSDPGAASSDAQEPPFRRFVEILRSDPKPDRGLRNLLSRLDELDDYGFFHLRESGGSLWESEQPTVIRIHTTQNDNLQRAFASLVFYGLYKDMFRRGIQDRITHALIFDEAHRAAGLKLIPTMAKECRKYGISLVLASQEARDFNVSLFSAIANYLVLRLTEADAKSLVRNVASSQHERTLMDKIKQMARFKALYFCEGRSKPYTVNLSS